MIVQKAPCSYPSSSDPSSSKYGQYYTADEVVDLFAPDENSVNAVKEWLVKSGIPASNINTPKSKGWLDFTTTVGQLQAMLYTTYHIYNHAEGKGQHIAAEEYSVPLQVSEYIDFITPAMAYSKKPTRVTQTNVATEIALPHPEFIAPVSPQLAKNLSADLGMISYNLMFLLSHY